MFFTTIAELKDYLPVRADTLNIFVCTSMLALRLDVDDEEAAADEVWQIADADTIQVEGFVLQPRKMRCFPVELSTSDPDEADYLLRIIRESTLALASRASTAMHLAQQPVDFGTTDVKLGDRLKGRS